MKTMKAYRIGVSCLAGSLILLLSHIPVFSQSDLSKNLKEIIQKFRQSSSWAESVAMNIESETLIVGGNPGHRRQKTVYRRDGERIEIIGQDCLLGRTGKLSEKDQLIEADFTRETTEENIWLVNEKCHMEAGMFAGGTRYRARIQYTDYKRHFEGYFLHEYCGNFLQGATSMGGGITNIPDVLDSDPGANLDTEVINGTLCYVIKAKVPQGRVTAWIAPDKGFNLLKYIIHKGSGDFFKEKPMDETRMEEWTVTVDSIEYEKIGDILVPVSGRYTQKILFKGGDTKSTSIRVKRSDIQLRPDFEALGVFKIKLPDGTAVEIEGAPGIIYKWQDGKLIANIDKYTIEQIDKMTEELRTEGKVLARPATDKKTEAAPNEPSVITDTKADTGEAQREVLSETRVSPVLVLIPIGLLIIAVITWRVFLLKRK